MLREAFNERLKQAMKARDARTLSAVRLILAALKEKDVAARTAGQAEPLPDSEILRLLQGMIKQRRDSIAGVGRPVGGCLVRHSAHEREKTPAPSAEPVAEAD